MRRKQLTICFFIGYLGLLLNLGPSLHYADFLGLHCHCSHSTISNCSSCCDGHCPTKTLAESYAIGADHDCAFCKFFDQFHVTLTVYEEPDSSLIIQACSSVRPISAVRACLVPTARGPPSTFA